MQQEGRVEIGLRVSGQAVQRAADLAIRLEDLP